MPLPVRVVSAGRVSSLYKTYSAGEEDCHPKNLKGLIGLLGKERSGRLRERASTRFRADERFAPQVVYSLRSLFGPHSVRYSTALRTYSNLLRLREKERQCQQHCTSPLE